MKMKNFTILLMSLCLTVFVSCKEEKKEATPTQSEVETNENPKTTAQVNPAHGEPGHSCAIPVGAPLNSEKKSSTQATTKKTSASNVSPIKTDQTPDVNPPHGEPGHDCAKPVGASLNSSNETQSSSGSADSPISVGKSSENVNPPHGEPGHDCSKPVGASLKE